MAVVTTASTLYGIGGATGLNSELAGLFGGGSVAEKKAKRDAGRQFLRSRGVNDFGTHYNRRNRVARLAEFVTEYGRPAVDIINEQIRVSGGTLTKADYTAIEFEMESVARGGSGNKEQTVQELIQQNMQTASIGGIGVSEMDNTAIIAIAAIAFTFFFLFRGAR